MATMHRDEALIRTEEILRTRVPSALVEHQLGLRQYVRVVDAVVGTLKVTRPLAVGLVDTVMAAEKVVYTGPPVPVEYRESQVSGRLATGLVSGRLPWSTPGKDSLPKARDAYVMERRALPGPTQAMPSLGDKLFGSYGRGLEVKLTFGTGPMLNVVRRF